MAGIIGPPAARRGLARRRSRHFAEWNAGDRDGVCCRICGSQPDRLRRRCASAVAADLSHPRVDRDPHHRRANSTKRAGGCGDEHRWRGLLLGEEGRVLRGVGRGRAAATRGVGRGRAAAALQIVVLRFPRRDLLGGYGPLDLGRSPGLNVEDLLLGELRRSVSVLRLRFILADRGRGSGGRGCASRRRARRQERSDEESAGEGKRAHHFGGCLLYWSLV